MSFYVRSFKEFDQLFFIDEALTRAIFLVDERWELSEDVEID